MHRHSKKAPIIRQLSNPKMATTERINQVTSRDMPSPRHDAINEFFIGDPGAVVEAMRQFLGVKLPANLPVRAEKTQFNDRPSKDFSADAVITVGPPQSPAHCIIVEIQQRGLEEKR